MGFDIEGSYVVLS